MIVSICSCDDTLKVKIHFLPLGVVLYAIHLCRNGRCPARLYMDKLLQKLSEKDSALVQAAQIVTLTVSLHKEQDVIRAYEQFDRGKQLKIVILSQK